MPFRGVFLTSEQPSETARFYRDVAGLPLEEVGSAGKYVYWKLDDGHMQLAIHEAQTFSNYTYPVLRESNTTHLYFHIADLAKFRTHLQQLGIQPYAVDDVVITLIDPDGRKVMFGTA